MAAEDQKRIALLIFALTPEAELLQKNLSGKSELYALLNEHTLKLAEGLGIPYFHFTEKEQHGNTFGERYTHAVRSIFSQGYDGIITIGNDSPGLNSEHLRIACKNLISGNSVLGPSIDGGFYLLAMLESSFSEEEFLCISWKSAHVFRQMYGILSKGQDRPIVLNPLCDLDVQTDIVVILDSYINIPFGIKKALIKAQKCIKIAETILVNYSSHHTQSRILNRGSPKLAA